MHRLLTFLVGCGAAAPAPQHPIGASLGTAAPYTIVAMPDHGQWSVICQARADTNKDGKLAVEYTMQGEAGDAMVAYYIDPAGHESVLDNVLAYTPRWLAAVEQGAPVLIDTQTGKREKLTGTRPEFHITAGLRVWQFDPSGEHLLFFRDGAPIVRTLATGAEAKIAPVAWRASWSADGSWVELEILDGDTNGDGFIHGPDLTSREAAKGCGQRFNWVAPLSDLDPSGERVDDAVASIENPDKLARRLWRVHDGFAIAGESAVDRDTIITRTLDDGGLVIGPVAAPGAPLADRPCSVAGVSPPLRAALVTCPSGEKFELFWFRDGRRESVAQLVSTRDLNIGAGLFEIDNVLGNMRTGAVVRNEQFLYMPWHDDEHALILGDDGFELRWTVSGRHMAFRRETDSDWLAAGRYAVYGTKRIDLQTGDTTTVTAGALRLREDGAMLFDGGPQQGDDLNVKPRVGPLRWVAR